jgi:hypothetical protein
LKNQVIKDLPKPGVVVHTCNPSYSRGRDHEDLSSNSTSSMTPYLEKPFTKMGLVEWLKVKALSSHPRTEKKKKKRYT